MESYKLDLRIGVHEFSAEGPVEIVRQDFELWKSLVEEIPAQETANRGSGQDGKPPALSDTAVTPEQIEKAFLLDERREELSLRMLPRSDDRNADALLLLILGYKLVKGLDEVMVTQLKPSLRQSGCMVERLDQVAAKYIRQGLLNKGGMGKGGRYSLTNLGLEKALGLLTGLTS